MKSKKKQKAAIAFKGWPKVTRLFNKRKVLSGYRITGRYLTPDRAKFANALWAALLVMALFDSVFVAFEYESWPMPFMLVLAFGLFAWVTFYGLRWLVAKLIFIEVWPDVIRVGKWFRFDTYDRKLQHQFDLVEHDKALDENMEFQRNTKIWRYYMDCAWVVLRHPSGSLRIAAVYPKQRAERLLERLQAVEMAGQLDPDQAEERGSGTPHTGPRPDPA